MKNYIVVKHYYPELNFIKEVQHIIDLTVKQAAFINSWNSDDVEHKPINHLYKLVSEECRKIAICPPEMEDLTPRVGFKIKMNGFIVIEAFSVKSAV